MTMNNQSKADVVNFNSSTVYQSIMSFLNDARLSKSTKIAYTKAIQDFFKFVSHKDISVLTEQDLLAIKNEDVKKYRTHMKNKGLANTSINAKIRAVSSLFQEIAKDRDGLNPAKVHLKPLHEGKNHYGELTRDEVNAMIELAKTKVNGIEKSLLLELAIMTSFRKNYLLSLRWCDIRKVNEDLYEIKGRDESSKMENEKSIKNEFYDRLSQLKKEDTKKTDKIFSISSRHVNDVFNDLVNELELDVSGERNLSFHSLKNFAPNFLLKTTKSIELAQQQSNHKNAKTLLEKYVRFSKDPAKNPSLLINEEIKTDILDGLSKEQLLEIIKSSNDFVKMELVNKANEMLR